MALARTGALAGLFTEDATCSTAPYEKPHRGLAAIARIWEAERVGPDEDFEMRSEIVAVEDDRGVVRVEVRYGEPKGSEYRDLWGIGLNESGHCFHFEEWPLCPPDQKGGAAAARPNQRKRDRADQLHWRVTMGPWTRFWSCAAG